MFKIGHSNDKKQTYKNIIGGGQSVRRRSSPVYLKCAFGDLEMRAMNPTELDCLESALPKANVNVYDLGLKQDESSRLRRIWHLEHENALLMRMVTETQIEIVRLRELLSSN